MPARNRTKTSSTRASRREIARPLPNEVPLQRDTDFDTTRRLALGTREIEKVQAPSITDDGEVVTSRHATHDVELASIPQPVLVIGPLGQIEYANELAQAWIGFTAVELVGQLFDRIVSDLRAAVEATRALEARVRFVPSVRVYQRRGREVTASVVLCPHGHGSVLALLTPHDPAADDHVPQSRLAEIVHDFKNPLATIALEMCLLDAKLEHQDADVADVVGRVTRNVEFLDSMVQDMLDSCAISAGELSLRRTPTDLRTLLQNVVERATPTRDRQRVFLEGPAGITLAVDELRIQRVVSNLLQNALKYTSHMSWIVVRLEAAAGVARVSVTDSGSGVKQDELPHIFDKYRRAAGARTREGHGLGLYVSKQIIEAHGGRIGVDSVHGVGSRFFFELPLT